MPNSKDLNGSLFDTVTTHTEMLDDHGNLLKQHADEISLLKKSDEDIMRELKDMKLNFTNLENTIWKTSQTTQDVMKNTQDVLKNTMDKQWELIGVRDANKHEITKSKLDKFWEYAGKVTMALVGSGGFFYVLLEAFAK